MIFIVCISISWCAKNTGDITDALKVYEAVWSTIFSSSVMKQFSHDHFNTTGILRESFGLYSNVNNDDIFSSINLWAIVDTADNNTQSSLSISWMIQDKSNGDELSASGGIYYIMSGNKQYVYLSTGDVGLGQGNAEWLLVQMILNNIVGQWILLDDNWFINMDAISLPRRENFWILTNITKSFFQDSWWLDFSYNIANNTYPIELTDKSLLIAYIQTVYNMLEITNDIAPNPVFIWHIQTQPTPRLVIENLEDAYNDWILSGSVWLREGVISISQWDDMWQVDWREKNKSIKFSITHRSLGEEIFFLSMSLIPQSIEGMLFGIWYDGFVRTNILSLAGEQTNITLPIAGLYTIHIVDSTQFAEPTRYLLMSQVFGDEYGIGKLLEAQ